MATETLIPKSPQALCNAIKHLSEEWEQSETGIKMVTSRVGKRSIPQNSTAHLWWSEAGEYFAEHLPDLVWDGVKFGDMKTKDQRLEAVKEMQKVQFLGYVERNMHDAVTGKSFKTHELKKTRDLDQGDMFNFMRQCEEQLLGWGVKITTPITSEYRELMERQND